MADEEQKMLQHAKSVHEKSNPLLCDMCEKTFLEESLLSEHIIATHLKTNFASQINEILKTYDEEKTDNNQKNPNQIYFDIFSNDELISMDLETLKNKCKEKGLSKEIIKILIRRRIDLKQYEKLKGYCNLCCKSFVNLKIHTDKIHKRIRKSESIERFQIKCKSCDSVFSGKNIQTCQNNLKIHVKTVHEGELNFKCHICEKAFWHPWHVRRHINSKHKQIKPASCDVCGKSFDSERYLKKFHQCRGSHKCNFCNKSFTEKNFQRHKCHKSKIDDGHLKCDVCSKSFTKEEDLIKHDCRNKKCDFCDNYFTIKVIHRHMERCQQTMFPSKQTDGITRNLKELSCDACGKSFNRKLYLKHHKCRNQKCDLCDSYFTIKVIQRHMERCQKSKNNAEKNGKNKKDTIEEGADKLKLCISNFDNLSDQESEYLKNQMKTFHDTVNEDQTLSKNVITNMEIDQDDDLDVRQGAIVQANSKNLIKPNENSIPLLSDNGGQKKLEVVRRFEDKSLHFSSRVTEAVSVIEPTGHSKFGNNPGHHKCNICGKCFSSTEFIKQHLKDVHQKIKPYKCKIIVKVCKNFEPSLPIFEKLKSFECDKCKKYFSFEHSMQILEKEKAYECNKCKKYFSQLGTLKTHIAEVHAKKTQAKESVVPNQESKYLNASSKTLSQTTLKEVKNAKSDSDFKQDTRLTHEVVTILDKKNFNCSTCGKPFLTARNVRKHFDQVHKKLRPYKCNECEKYFSQLGNLKAHIVKRHNKNQMKEPAIESNQELIPSEISLAIQKPQTTLKEVKNVMSPKLDVNLEIAKSDSDFKQDTRLTHEEATILDKKNFNCSTCGKPFSTARNVKNHFDQVHKKLKPYKCNECEKYFSQLGNLKAHIVKRHNKNQMKEPAIESNQELIPSEISVAIQKNLCDDEQNKMFELKNTTTELFPVLKPEEHHKPIVENLDTASMFKCNSCETFYARRVSLTRHIKIVHEGQNPIAFKCSSCDQCFTHSNSLKRHREKIHKRIYDLPTTTGENQQDMKIIMYENGSNNETIDDGRNSGDNRVRDLKKECSICNVEFSLAKLKDHEPKCGLTPNIVSEIYKLMNLPKNQNSKSKQLALEKVTFWPSDLDLFSDFKKSDRSF